MIVCIEDNKTNYGMNFFHGANVLSIPKCCSLVIHDGDEIRLVELMGKDREKTLMPCIQYKEDKLSLPMRNHKNNQVS